MDKKEVKRSQYAVNKKVKKGLEIFCFSWQLSPITSAKILPASFVLCWLFFMSLPLPGNPQNCTYLFSSVKNLFSH